MEIFKILKSPVQTGIKLSRYDGDPISNAQENRSVLGALQYVTLTRADIAFAVDQVCQFMYDPRSHHWIVVKRILRFLKGTITHGLHFRRGTFSVTVYSNADLARDLDDCR
ncbi:hypothetical protein AAC387_Pa08g0801 [Persea americana]